MSRLTNNPCEPTGTIVIRTIAMPCDTNANGDIFGGWLMSQLDLGGGVLSRQIAQSRVITAAVENLSFVAPVYTGDTVTCYAELLSTGRTSMRIALQAWAIRHTDASLHHVASGTYIYVSIDQSGKPFPLPDSAKKQ